MAECVPVVRHLLRVGNTDPPTRTGVCLEVPDTVTGYNQLDISDQVNGNGHLRKAALLFSCGNTMSATPTAASR